MGNERIIGEFDLCEYGLPRAYLVHKISNGGNFGDKYPENREYLYIVSYDREGNKTIYGYIYFMLHFKEGIFVSQIIGLNVSECYRNRGLGDLLMSIYLVYCYEQGAVLFESITRQRKLDVLSLMNKYGFVVSKPEVYDNGRRTTLFRNNMVVDIFKQNQCGIYFRFKTEHAQRLYKANNLKIAENYHYLLPEEIASSPEGYTKLGWVVPNEAYERRFKDDSIIQSHLIKSKYSK